MISEFDSPAPVAVPSSVAPLVALPETHIPADDFIKALKSILTGSDMDCQIAADNLKSKAQECYMNQAKYGRTQEERN